MLASVSRMFSKSLPNVKHLYGDSHQPDFGQISERFDVIFVDGCHEYSSVVSDTKNAVKLLRNDESIIVFHDAKNAYNEIEPEVLVGIHDGLPPDWRNHLYTVANTLCAVVTKHYDEALERISLGGKSVFKANPKVDLGFESTDRLSTQICAVKCRLSHKLNFIGCGRIY